MKKSFKFLSAVVLFGSALLSAVSVSAQDDVLKFGLMPASDSVPMLWAAEKGYFEEAGVNVELVTFTNGNNRNSAMRAGELAGDIEGLMEVISAVQEDPSVGRIVSNTNDHFVLVQSKDYQEDESKELVIGGMLHSVIHYLTVKQFEDYKGGYREEFIPEIPVRIQMLLQNEIDFAILPEPVASSAVAQGLTKTELGVDEDVNAIVFRPEYLEANQEAVKAFLVAYDRAVEDLQDEANVEEAKKLLVSTFELPEALVEHISFPKFETSKLPSEEYVTSVQEWLTTEFDETYDVPYKEFIFDVSAQ